MIYVRCSVQFQTFRLSEAPMAFLNFGPLVQRFRKPKKNYGSGAWSNGNVTFPLMTQGVAKEALYDRANQPATD